MSFKDDIKKHIANIKKREGQLFKEATELAYESVRFGSPITGAPGQPVEFGDLLASWRLEIRSKRVAAMFTPLFYGPIIEDNLRGAQLRSSVGGFHSVLRTRLAWQQIVDHVARGLDGKGGEVPSGAPILTPGWNRNARGRFSERHTAQIGIKI
jgi:hypothetical protein